MTLFDLLAASIAERKAFPAVNGVSYGDLALGILRIARALRERGVGPGDRVALFCENRLAFVYTYLAVLRLGAIAVPTNVLYRSSDLAHILADADVRLVLVSAQTAPHLAALAVPAVLDADEVERLAAAADGLPSESGPLPAPESPAIIVYTSGTTGRSKGAVLTHGNLAVIAAQLTTAWRWTAADTLVIALPLFHVHGLCAALNATLACGAQLVVHERFDAAAIVAELQRSRATMFFGVPTMYVRLLELAGGAVIPPLRLCVSGSAALSAEVFERFEQRFGITILERYGATEFGFALGNRYGGPRVPGSVGIPFAGVRVRVAAADGLEAAGPGDVGELLVSGPNVFAEYWRNAAATAGAFCVDGDGTRWYRSGDLAAYDVQRQVYRIVGRLKELIITGGFNVYPLEVETEIDHFPGVRASAVVGAPDAACGESVAAFIETEPGSNVQAAELTAWLHERLASFKIPKRVECIDALPRNALGKIEKAKLRALL